MDARTRQTSLLDETERLESLLRHQLLDTPPEPAFDNITKLAAMFCEAPTSLITLLDDSRQWFKSRFGLDAEETPREHAFCDYAIRSREPMIVSDARRDSRFTGNPFVTGAPHIRFYAGLPLVMRDGAAFGTLCILDHRPRDIGDEQLRALELLRDEAVCYLELRYQVLSQQPLSDLLLSCAWCRKVRKLAVDDTEYQWIPIETYIREHQRVTHGICPDCKQQVLAELKSKH